MSTRTSGLALLEKRLMSSILDGKLSMNLPGF
jgi:hypothetical protein